MSRLMLAVAALTLSLGRTAGAQAPYGAAAYTAEVGGVEIDRVPRYRARHPFEAPKPRAPVASRGGWTWVPGHWAVPPRAGMRHIKP